MMPGGTVIGADQNDTEWEEHMERQTDLRGTRFPGLRQYPQLFSPLRLGNIRLKNRIIAAPTSPSMITAQGHFTPEMIAYLEEKARGGAAVVTYGEAIVHSATGKSHNKQLQLDAFGVRQGLAQAARAIHNGGAYASIQLSHGGKYGGLASVGGDVGCCAVAYGPSAEQTPAGEVREMPEELIREIVCAYGAAAKLCKECGFDMVQIHAAHGWLFSQFLSPKQNRRTDAFGGSLENRARILLMALDAVRAAVGPAFPIEIRLSGDDLSDEGMTAEECVQVAKLVEGRVELMNISCGNHEDPDLFCRTHPSAFYPRGVNVYLAARIREAVSCPVACVGSLNDPGQMEQILRDGQADVVELGRALLADPMLPRKAKEGRAQDITPCVRCYECFGETVRCESIKCTVNPRMGQQLTVPAETGRAPEFKTVLVVGGGPGGMQAAITAAQRGHKVTLAEKSDQLGGNLLPAGAPEFKRDLEELRRVLIRRVEQAGVKVVLNQCVDDGYVRQAAPDALVVAVGAEELTPPVPGIELPIVKMAAAAELAPQALGRRVVIIGGGLVGCELAISLHKHGKECVVIEAKPAVADEANPFYRGGLMPQLAQAAEVMTQTSVCEIRQDGVVCVSDGKRRFVSADSVVCAVGFRAPWALVDRLCAGVPEHYIIGDCAKVGQVGDAISGGYFTALQI